MSLKTLSKYLPLERVSLSFKLSETAQLKSSKQLQEYFTKQLNDLRDSNWPDKGFSFDLTDCKRLNFDFKKFILTQIQTILKKNIINVDIWVSQKPSKEVKKFILEIKTEIKKHDKTSVRIRVDRSKATYNPFLILNWALGVLVFIGGSTNLFEANIIKLNFIDGLNGMQLFGMAMTFFGMLPYCFKYYFMARRIKE